MTTSNNRSIFDIVIVGGGIYGAWMSHHATNAGLKTLLLEQADFASATSMASSKLIHGGLRYLENFEFSLVYKSLQERHRLHRMMPHSIQPLRFFVPIYKDSRVKPFKLNLGLWCYDLLSWLKPFAGRHKKHTLSNFLTQEKNIQSQNLKAIFSYGDGQTDDARLVIDIIKHSSAEGLEARNYVEVQDIQKNADGLKLQCHDQETMNTYNIHSRSVFISAGPWIENWISKANCITKPKIRLTRGIHITVPQFCKHHAYLLQAPQDGRFFFIFPWYGRNIIGTTDTDSQYESFEIQDYQNDVQYLLKLLIIIFLI